MTEKIIIDTDPGIDDALAIACAFAEPTIDVLALTSVFGNASVTQTTENSLRILDVLEQNTPVYPGAHRPLAIPPKDHPSLVHGENGLGNIPQPKAKRNPETVSAAQYIVNAANQYPGEIVIVALGPLTNLALAVALDPTVAEKIKRVVTMGGNLHVPGNVSASAEANIFCDPHAADQVYNAGWPVSVVGLDVTHQIITTPEYFQRLETRQPVTGKFLNQITRFYMDFYQSCYKIKGCHVHDSSAIACAAHPEWFGMETGQLKVVCDGEFKGKLLMHKDAGYSHRFNPWLDKPEIEVATQVDVQAVTRWLDELF